MAENLRVWPVVLFCWSLIVALPAFAATPCKLTLVYKMEGKPGYMDRAPSNLGLYQALYSEVAERTGCQLIIERYPKKRTLLLLEHGEADLYPSTGFDHERANFMFYIPNGLYRYEPYYGLTPLYVPDLKSISEIKEYGLSWIFEAGNTTIHTANEFGVESEQIVGLTYARAIEMLRRERTVFYRIIQGDYEKLLEEEGVTDLRGLNIATHKHCCETKSQKLYLGFSRQSPHFAEEPNPEYDLAQPVTADNFPTRLSKNSTAYRVAKALSDMEASGRVNKLYMQYIIEPGHTP